jgi:hypothetical protein
MTAAAIAASRSGTSRAVALAVAAAERAMNSVAASHWYVAMKSRALLSGRRPKAPRTTESERRAARPRDREGRR